MMHPLVKEYCKDLLGQMMEQPKAGKRKDSLPFTKLIDDGSWRVSRGKHPSDGYVDHQEKVLHVPVDESGLSERTRFHELGHVIWTDRDVKPDVLAAELEVPQAFLNAMEDARINRHLVNSDGELLKLLGHEGNDVDVKGTVKRLTNIEQVAAHWMDGEMPQELVGALAGLYAATPDYMEHTRLRTICKRAGIPTDRIDRLMEQTVLKPDATFEETKLAAQRLRDLLWRPEGDEEEQDGQQPGEGVPVDYPVVDELSGLTKATLSPMDSKPMRFDIPSGDEEKEASEEEKWGKIWGRPDIKSSGASSYVEPGVMQVLRPRLTERIVRKMNRPRVKRHDLAGGEIRSIHRIVTDEKILLRKSPTRSRRKIGTMLIDVSGSMRIRLSQIDAILNDAPQVTIALYGSNDKMDRALNSELVLGEVGYKTEYMSGRVVGHLSVIAHKGKRIPSSEVAKHIGGGNIVDVEALRWLSSQPGPRVWICDGIVTGCNDMMGKNINQECEKLVARCRAAQFLSMEHFFEMGGVNYVDQEDSPIEGEDFEDFDDDDDYEDEDELS